MGTDDGLNRLQQAATNLNGLTSLKHLKPRCNEPPSYRQHYLDWHIRGGLTRLDTTSNETTTYLNSLSDPASLGANGVTSLLYTKNGDLLVGTYGGGLNLLIRRQETSQS